MARRPRGFTLIELLVVMAIVATLLSVALPRYVGSAERAKEVGLKQTLHVTRDAIDKFYADRGHYPAALGDLVQSRYLRSAPVDPVTGSTETWVTLPPPAGTTARGDVYDLRSGAAGRASDGTDFSTW